VFFGFILLSSTIMITLPGIIPEDENSEVTVTGTPADNFKDADRARFCGSSIAKSTDYVKEFSIPTFCTQPNGITSDYDGKIWFTQQNLGGLTKFDPVTEEFTSFPNLIWPQGTQSTMTGIDVASDGSIWFTDQSHNSLWKFLPSTEQYENIGFPSDGSSFPQQLEIHGSKIIVNDFFENKIVLLNPIVSDDSELPIVVPSPMNFLNSPTFTGDFGLDANGSIWFTNWQPVPGGLLVKFDQEKYFDSVMNSGVQSLPSTDFLETFSLPDESITPVGLTISDAGLIWIADPSTSSFFSFDPISHVFTQYSTSDPLLETYGNQTGVIKSPISRPYWIETDDQDRLIFIEQTGNNISLMDPSSQSLIEYQIPSKNPYWADCIPGDGIPIDNCGIAQIFGITSIGEKIWFTEWVENNIGVVDTSVPLPIEIQLESNSITLSPGDSQHFNYVVSPNSQKDLFGVSLITNPTHEFLSITLEYSTPESFQLDFDAPRPIHTEISASEDAVPGVYKILLGAQSSDVAVSKFITVTIE